MDALQQTGANDAAPFPDLTDGREVEVVVVQLGGFLKQGHALAIAHDASSDAGIPQRFHPGLNAAEVKPMGGGGGKQGFCREPFRAQGTQHPGIQGCIDGGHGDPHFQGADHGPEAGSLLPSRIHNVLHQVGAIGGVFGAQADLRDLHQKRGQLFGLVPLAQNISHLLTTQASNPLHQVVGLGKDLLNAVFNAVVDGLDEMAGTAGADVGDAGAVIDLGRHLLNQGLDRVVGSLGATWHHARPFQGTLGPPGDPHADVAKTLAFQFGNPALGVGVEGIAPIDQQITLLQEWGDRSNGVIDRLTGLHHHQNAARAFQQTHELLKGFRSHDLFTRSQTHQELLGFRIGAVVNGTGKTIALGIKDEVLAHHAQTNEAEMRLAH